MGEEGRAEEVFGSFFFLLFLFFLLPLDEGGCCPTTPSCLRGSCLQADPSSSPPPLSPPEKARTEQSTTATLPLFNRGTHNRGADCGRAARGSDPCGSDTAASLPGRHPPNSSSNSVKSSGSSPILVVSSPRGTSCVPGHPLLGELW